MSKLIKVGLLISGKISSSVKRSTDTAVKDQSRVGSAIRKVNSQFGQAREARKYGRLLNDLKKKQRGLGHSSARLDRGIEEVERRYNEARRAASRYGSEIGDVERQTRRLGDTQRRQGEGLSKSQIGTAIGAAGGAALTAGIVGAGNREEEGIYLRTVINAKDGDKDAAVGRSRAGARAFARNSLADEPEIISIEYALNSAGLEEEVSRAGARMVHKVAKITKGNASQVGEIIGTTFNNLGGQMVGTAEEKMTRIGNILTKTQFKFQIRDFGQLGASMEYGLATAASYKIGLEQTAAAIGFLNSAGFQGSRGGTAFAAMMRSMTKAGDELGFSMIRSADGSLDFMSTMRELAGSLEGLETDAKADLIGKIFGDEGKGGVIAMINSLDRLKDGYDAVNAASQSDLVNEEYTRFLEITNGTLRKVGQNILQIGTTIGGDLTPVVNVLGSALNGVLGGLGWALENIPGVGFAVGALATVIVGTAIAMGAATTATWAWNAAMMITTNRRLLGFVGLLTKGLWGFALRAAPAAVVGIRAIGAALLLNPIGLAVTAIALGAVLLIKFWKPISGFFGRVFGGMAQPALKAYSIFKTVLKWSPMTLLRAAWNALPGVFKGVFGVAGRIVKFHMDAIKTVILGPLKLVTGLWEKIKGVKNTAANITVGSAVNDNTSKRPPDDDNAPKAPPPPGPGQAFISTQTVNSSLNIAEHREFNETVTALKTHVQNETDNETRNTAIDVVERREIGEIFKKEVHEKSELIKHVGETVDTTRNIIINDTRNIVSTKRVGRAVNDNAFNDNAPPPPLPGKVYAALNTASQPKPRALTPALYAPVPPAQVTHTHTHEGNVYTIHVQGVTDGETAAREIKRHLERLEREDREADLHD